MHLQHLIEFDLLLRREHFYRKSPKSYTMDHCRAKSAADATSKFARRNKNSIKKRQYTRADALFDNRRGRYWTIEGNPNLNRIQHNAIST